MVAAGLTGQQTTKWIDAPRIYIKSTDSTPTPVVIKSNGALPTGWTDLGIVNGKFKITYQKDVKEVRTGIDETLRAIYIGKKTAKFEFQLSQFDDVTMSQLSGLTASQITNGSIYQYGVGIEDVVQKALLLVSQNKLDGKEWQFYSPLAYLSFGITDNNQETVLAGVGDLPSFAWAGSQALMVSSIFA